MPAKVLKGTMSYVVPAQCAIVKGGCGGREGLEVTVKHLSQIVMEFRRIARRVFRVAKVILFQGRVGWPLIEKGLYGTVNVRYEDIFFAFGYVHLYPNREFFALSGV